MIALFGLPGLELFSYRRVAKRSEGVAWLDAPWTPTEVEAHRLAWARIRAVCLLVVWIARVTS